jgi:hypothetical protein
MPAISDSWEDTFLDFKSNSKRKKAWSFWSNSEHNFNTLYIAQSNTIYPLQENLQPCRAPIEITPSICLSKYAQNNLRPEKPILIQFNIGEFYEKVSKLFNFHLDWTVLMTLHNSIQISWCNHNRSFYTKTNATIKKKSRQSLHCVEINLFYSVNLVFSYKSYTYLIFL